MTEETRYTKYQQRVRDYVEKQIARYAKYMVVPAYFIVVCLIVLWRMIQGRMELNFLIVVVFLFTAVFSAASFLDTQKAAESIMYFSKGWHIQAVTGRIARRRRKNIYAVEITVGREKYEEKKTKKKRAEKKQKPYLKTRKKANIKFAQEYEIREENREEAFAEGDEITMLYTADAAINTPYIVNRDKTGRVIAPASVIYAYVEDGTTVELLQEIGKGGQVMLSKKEILFRIYLRMLMLLACSVLVFFCIFSLLK